MSFIAGCPVRLDRNENNLPKVRKLGDDVPIVQLPAFRICFRCCLRHDTRMRLLNSLPLLLGAALLAAFHASGAAIQPEARDFGKMPDGATVKLFTMRNGNGMVAKVMT